MVKYGLVQLYGTMVWMRHGNDGTGSWTVRRSVRTWMPDDGQNDDDDLVHDKSDDEIREKKTADDDPELTAWRAWPWRRPGRAQPWSQLRPGAQTDDKKKSDDKTSPDDDDEMMTTRRDGSGPGAR